MAREDFPIDESLVEKFIEVNKKKWAEVKHNQEYIYLNFSMVRMQAAWIVPKLVYAKGLEESTGAKPIAFTWRDNDLLTKFIESYGIEHIALHNIMKKNFGAIVKAIFRTLGFMLFDGTGEGLKKMKVCNIAAGKSLYEDIIRTSNLSTIKSARNKICLKKMFHILWMLYSLDAYVTKHPAKVCVADDIAYHEGLILKLMKKKGAAIFASNYQQEREVLIDANDGIETIATFSRKLYAKMVDGLDESAVAFSEKHLEERFKGKNGRTIDRGAFANKKVITRDDLIEMYHLDPNKKNVVIMAHTFSDAVFNYGELYFRDYYDWLEKTLELASQIKSVNWVLKPHPTRSAYNEAVDSIEKMFERYKQDNMAFLADEISAESIINFADVQVTIGGNSGGEFSCFGIPTIIVGKPYYSGFGYTTEPESFEAYKKCLENASEIPKLTEDQIIMAKKLFYLRNADQPADGLFLYKDAFGTLVNSEYQKMLEEYALQYFVSNEGTQKYNDEILNKICAYVEQNDMKETQYYSRAFERGSALS